MTVDDDSFTQPGAVPFEWEIRPGVPKVQQKLSPDPKTDEQTPSQSPVAEQVKLTPPPSVLGSFPASPESGSRSFHSSLSSRSSRRLFGRPGPQIVAPSGCFLTPLLKRVHSKQQRAKEKTKAGQSDPVCGLETFSCYSGSTRRSLSFVPDSDSSSSLSSDGPSSQLMNDAEWAWFGLF